jgi:soluble lytic murein transglycosylase
MMLPRSVILAAIGCGLLGGLPSTTRSSDLPTHDESLLIEQRRVFRDIYPDVELGEWRHAAQHAALLQDYVLWPDLQAAYYKGRLGKIDEREVREYLQRYGILKPARELRYQYALFLAEQGRLAEFFEIYQQYYQGLDIAKLDCYALQAEMLQGRHNRIVNRARDLWLVGRNQEESCDPVFDDLRHRRLIDKEEYATRFALAIAERQFSLARYLARSLDEDYLHQANAWISAQKQPGEFLDNATKLGDTATSRDQISYAIGRLALNDPLRAQRDWDRLSTRFAFDDSERIRVGRHIALWAAREHLPEAHAMLSALPAQAIDTETARWQVRVNLTRRDWGAVIDSIDAMPNDERRQPEWQFWKAHAESESGAREASLATFRALAKDRSYYGFLAADQINAPYAFEHLAIYDEQQVSTDVTNLPELIRARELFLVGLDSRGRSEWDAATRNLNRETKIQAAILAHRLGWHSRAIATMAQADSFDDLDIRYPLPWRDDFEQFSKAADIPHSWAYGIARSESLFMPDVRSSAGAVGLMQLMPATGRETAREINLRYGGLATLTDSTSNIRLGTAYLGKMFDRFGKNRVLATAAYNAGPHRVQKWLADRSNFDARIWIENIPYLETRNYVRRVLVDEAIFHWRLTGQTKRISNDFPLVGELKDPAQLPSSN